MQHTPPTCRKLSPVPQNDPNPTAPQPDPDQPLVRAAQSGDARALASLLDSYQHRLFAVCLRMLGTDRRSHQTASDLTQDALLKLLAGLPTFDHQSLFSTWAIRITMNVVLSHLRSAKLRNHASLSDHAAAFPGPSNPASRSENDGRLQTVRISENTTELSAASRVEHTERAGTVADALTKIDPHHRALLILRDVQGLDYEHIASALDIPLGTVKSRLFRARLALRAVLEPASIPASTPSHTPPAS